MVDRMRVDHFVTVRFPAKLHSLRVPTAREQLEVVFGGNDHIPCQRMCGIRDERCRAARPRFRNRGRQAILRCRSDCKRVDYDFLVQVIAAS